MRCVATTGSAADARAVDTLAAAELAAVLDEPRVDLHTAVLQLLGPERISRTGTPAGQDAEAGRIVNSHDSPVEALEAVEAKRLSGPNLYLFSLDFFLT
jgi:hypothetical protein